MDDTLNRFQQCRIDNIHNDKETIHTDSTLHGYIYMPIVNTIYGYQESELNHMGVWKEMLLIACFQPNKLTENFDTNPS